MPLVPNIETFRLGSWEKGVNTEDDPTRLESTEYPQGDNLQVGLRGELIRRNGYVRDPSDVPAVVDEEILAMLSGVINGNNELFAFGNDGQFFRKRNGGAWTEEAGITFDAPSANSNAPDYVYIGRIVAEGSAYFTQKGDDTEAPRKYDGTSWSTVAAIPKARYLAYKDGRMFAANDTTRPSAVYFSDLNDVETWGGTNYVEFDPDDGTEITGMAIFGDDLIVFKPQKVFIMVGKDPDDYTIYDVSRSFGTDSSNTIVNYHNGVAFFDQNNGVIWYDGAQFHRISGPIANEFRFGSDHSPFDFAYVEGEYLLMAITVDDEFPRRTFVYDHRNQAWSIYLYGVRAAARHRTNTDLSGPGLWHIGGPDEANGVYTIKRIGQASPDTTDNGTDIPVTFKTPWFAPFPGRLARLHRIEVLFNLYADSPVATIKMYRNFETAAHRTKQISLNAADHGGANQLLAAFTGWGNRWEFIQFEITQDSGTGFELKFLDLFVSAGRDLRGSSLVTAGGGFTNGFDFGYG